MSDKMEYKSITTLEGDVVIVPIVKEGDVIKISYCGRHGDSPDTDTKYYVEDVDYEAYQVYVRGLDFAIGIDYIEEVFYSPDKLKCISGCDGQVVSYRFFEDYDRYDLDSEGCEIYNSVVGERTGDETHSYWMCLKCFTKYEPKLPLKRWIVLSVD